MDLRGDSAGGLGVDWHLGPRSPSGHCFLHSFPVMDIRCCEACCLLEWTWALICFDLPFNYGNINSVRKYFWWENWKQLKLFSIKFFFFRVSNVFNLKTFLVIMPLCAFVLFLCLTSILLIQQWGGEPRRAQPMKDGLLMRFRKLERGAPRKEITCAISFPNAALKVERNLLFGIPSALSSLLKRTFKERRRERDKKKRVGESSVDKGFQLILWEKLGMNILSNRA